MEDPSIPISPAKNIQKKEQATTTFTERVTPLIRKVVVLEVLVVGGVLFSSALLGHHQELGWENAEAGFVVFFASLASRYDMGI